MGLSLALFACNDSCNEVAEIDRDVVIPQLLRIAQERKESGKINQIDYHLAGIHNPEKFERWLAKLKAYTILDDSRSMAKLVRYPIKVNLYDGSGNKTMSSSELVKLHIENPKDFCKHYKNFMTHELKDMISNTPYDSLIIDKTPGSILLKMGYVHIKVKEGSAPEDYEVSFIFN